MPPAIELPEEPLPTPPETLGVAFVGLNDGGFRRGDELNQSLELDIEVYDECRAFFGDRSFGGHRDGAAGRLAAS